MSAKLEKLAGALEQHLAGRVYELKPDRGEVTLILLVGDYLDVMRLLRDHDDFSFEELIDLCGVDYSTHARMRDGKRFAAVSHLLSLQHNWRLRVRVFAEDDAFPQIPSLIQIWKSADWFEREAFDLFGIAFSGHPDLRRILTDYGFVGHPFRKDFPVSGHVEMRYDPEQKRVIYQPVTIEPRENTPRVVREKNFGGARG